jgi:predicted PurR-regulated permease PerM
MNVPQERDDRSKALDIAIHLAVIAAFVYGSYKIMSPFLVAVVWAILIAITLYPVYQRMESWVGGRSKLAGTLFIVFGLAVLIAPTALLTNSLLDATVRIVQKAQAGTLEIPPPTDKVKTWPLIGEKVYVAWESASEDLAGTAQKLQPQLGHFAQKIVSSVGGLGAALVQTLIAIVLAGILMITAPGGARIARAVAVRLEPTQGPRILTMAVGTIRSVVKGVILVAMIQGLLAGLGLMIASVPGAGLWALLTMMLAVMQLPTILVLGPIIPWVFAHNDSTAIAIFFTVWVVVIGFSDNVLKPIFLGRGMQVPMPVILVGAIGGMLHSGIIGLLIGPVILAIFYTLFMAWTGEGADEAPGVEEKSA